jgi:hypothetical protein
MSCVRSTWWIAAAVFAAAPAALAIDGGPPPGGEYQSYYEAAVETSSLDASASMATTLSAETDSGGLPTSLHTIGAEGSTTYRDLGYGRWRVDVAIARRPHEQVDAVYDLVLALPLPVGATASDWRIYPRTGLSSRSKPLVYGGETVVLKRNVPLESSWLPLLVGAPEGLPDLSRSGYVWTLWDSIVRYDAAAGATLEAYGTFRYSADLRAVAPNAGNPDNAAYVITWIPTLGVPPFAIRLDVVAAGQE